MTERVTRKRGRPKFSRGVKLGMVAKVNLTISEKKLVQDRAKQAGQSVSAYLRARGLA